VHNFTRGLNNYIYLLGSRINSLKHYFNITVYYVTRKLLQFKSYQMVNFRVGFSSIKVAWALKVSEYDSWFFIDEKWDYIYSFILEPAWYIFLFHAESNPIR